ncbi:hypothetical protein HOD38_04920 [archaeon]|jgi:hypothetical protein|nr:hypothetical protein [archaeon]MBT4397583.1 hypothetical protein [archaeon]MBT4440838.1 hypothetical protein [archaeon]
MATLGACGDERPEDRKAEQKRAKKVHKFNEIGEMPITMVAYPGCIEGDRVPVSVKGDDRAVLLFGTADMIARYVIGEEVALPKKGKGIKSIPKALRGQTFKRNVTRRYEEPVERIGDEMHGTGGVGELAKRQNKTYKGYTLKANGDSLTADSIVNSYFTEMVFVEGPEGRPVPKSVDDLVAEDVKILRKDQEVHVLGGVEMVITAILVSGQYEPAAKTPAYGDDITSRI